MPIPNTSPQLDSGAGSLSDAAFEQLSIAVVDGTFESGETLAERDLERWLGISRTPIRAALHRLHVLGLVEIQPSRHTRVTAVSATTVRETLEFTGYQAGLAVRMAVPRMNATDRRIAADMVEDMVAASEAGDATDLFDASRRLVGLMTHQSGNRIFMKFLAEAALILARNLRGQRPMLGSVQERRECYETLRDAILRGDGGAAEDAFRRQHQLELANHEDPHHE